MILFDLETWFDLQVDPSMTWKYRAQLRGVSGNATAYSRDSMEEALEHLRKNLVSGLAGEYEPLVIRSGHPSHPIEYLIWRSPLHRWSISRLSPDSVQEEVEEKFSGYETREEAAHHVLTVFLPGHLKRLVM